MGEDGDGDYDDDGSKDNCRNLARTTEDTEVERSHTRQGEDFRLQRLCSRERNLVRQLGPAIRYVTNVGAPAEKLPALSQACVLEEGDEHSLPLFQESICTARIEEFL